MDAVKKPTVYTYAKCSTCRNAVKWLRAEGIDFEEKPIRESPPTPAELKRMLAFQVGALKRLFNTSGGDYRELKLGSKLPDMTEQDAFALLASNGNLVKRPFLLTDTVGLVGFKADDWALALT
jgi:arsenate reductase (glutaredoxin)